MNKLQLNSNRNLTDALLHYLWRNWSALGVAGNVEPENKKIIDPEALLLLTCSVGRCDQRLFDEVTDWLTANWELVNINRLKNMLKRYQWSGKEALHPLAAWLIEHQKKFTKWKSLAELPVKQTSETPFFMDRDAVKAPLFGELEPIFLRYGFSRGMVHLRGYSRSFQKENPACLLLALRSFLGTNVRAEIMAYLLTHPKGAHPTGIANNISYYQKTAQNALTSMKKSQWVNCREAGFEKIYSLSSSVAESFTGKKKPQLQWVNLSPIYCLIEKVWEATHDENFSALSPEIQSIEMREAVMLFAKEIHTPPFSQILSGESKGKNFVDALIEGVLNFIEE